MAASRKVLAGHSMNMPFNDQAQLLAGSLMDYALPRADHLPSIDLYFRGT